MELPNQQYYEAHASTLEAITSEVVRLTVERPDETVSVSIADCDTKYGTPRLHHVERAFADQAILPASMLGVDDERLAAITIGISTLHMLAKMYTIAEEQPQTTSDEFLAGVLRASYRARDVSDELAVTTITTESDYYGVANQYTVVQSDHDLDSELSIITIGLRTVAVENHFKVPIDTDTRRWLESLGSIADMDVLRAASGIFENEQALDDTIQRAIAGSRGTYDEAEIAEAFQQFRSRAISAKESLRMRKEFKIELPSAEELSDILSALQNN